MKDRETDRLTDDELDRALASLPYRSPGPGFADRVMARVAVPAAIETRRPVAPRPVTRPSLAVAASLAVAVIGSLAASVVWSLGHQALLASLGEWLGGQAKAWAWVGVRAFAEAATALPKVPLLRGSAVSLSTLAAASTFGSLVYLSGLLTLRRLLIVPTRQVMHAER